MSKNESKPSEPFNFVGALIVSPLTIGVLALILKIWPNAAPWPLFHFWIWDWSQIWEAALIAWPVYLWGGGITFWRTFGQKIPKEAVQNAETEILAKGLFTSLMAGTLEEFMFRWILFYTGMIGAKFSAFLFFGWLSSNLELSRLLSWYVVSPCVNFVFFFQLGWLLYEMGWVVGAGALAANAKFRSGHAYLGPLGYVNSWAGGFYLFWIMFNYGLPAAMLVHFLYDAIIYSILYLHAVGRRVTDDDTPPPSLPPIYVPTPSPRPRSSYLRASR